MPTHCVLPPEFTIYAAGELHRVLAALSADATIAECVLDGAAVSELDACGIQLLLSLEQSLAGHGRTLRIAAASEPLSAGLHLLGAGHLLQEASP